MLQSSLDDACRCLLPLLGLFEGDGMACIAFCVKFIQEQQQKATQTAKLSQLKTLIPQLPPPSTHTVLEPLVCDQNNHSHKQQPPQTAHSPAKVPTSPPGKTSCAAGTDQKQDEERHGDKGVTGGDAEGQKDIASTARSEDIVTDEAVHVGEDVEVATDDEGHYTVQVTPSTPPTGSPTPGLAADSPLRRCNSLTKDGWKQRSKSTLNQMSFERQFEPKLFNDPVHGTLIIAPILCRVIDTPTFQRLRYLSQLGGTKFVYPGAEHSRFGHSLGVAHLAGELLRHLQEAQPELRITVNDIICVQLAGLCHDLGHGPFSHLFDGLFMTRARPGHSWTHEQGSVALLRHLLRKNNLESEFTPEDLLFVEELIDTPKDIKDPAKPWPCRGRSPQKCFLYQIVANKLNGVDVDKWDYFARDCHHLGIANQFQHKRLIHKARVLEDQNHRHILCFSDKDCLNIFSMFATRNFLHRLAYQHPVSNGIEIMIVEAFVEADRVLKENRTDQSLLDSLGLQGPLSESIDDIEGYARLDDSIFLRILHCQSPKMAKASSLLRAIQQRKLYVVVEEIADHYMIGELESGDLRAAIVNSVPDAELPVDHSGQPCRLDPDDIILDRAQFSYGMGSRNPIDNVMFYKKGMSTPFKIRKSEVSQMLPDVFAETRCRVYCKRREKCWVESATICLLRWCKTNGIAMPSGGSEMALSLTPCKKVRRPMSATPSASKRMLATPTSRSRNKRKLEFATLHASYKPSSRATARRTRSRCD